MRATTKRDNLDNCITVNRKELARVLGIGADTAEKIGEAAGAVVRFGRLKRYNIAKVREYVDNISQYD